MIPIYESTNYKLGVKSFMKKTTGGIHNYIYIYEIGYAGRTPGRLRLAAPPAASQTSHSSTSHEIAAPRMRSLYTRHLHVPHSPHHTSVSCTISLFLRRRPLSAAPPIISPLENVFGNTDRLYYQQACHHLPAIIRFSL